MKTQSLFVSVIIPVFNDAARLKLCLQALEDQTYPAALYEVIVVDNGSNKEVEHVCSHFPHVSYTRECKAGSYAARNKGLAVAKAELLAFTDADCIPQDDWLEKGVNKLTSVTNCGLVGGKVKLFLRDASRPTAVELYESVFGFPQKSNVESRKFSVTANLFTFRSVFDEVGLFDERLKSGGDKEWGKRVFSAGYRLVYANDVVVAHPARASLSELYRKEIRIAGGLYRAEAKNGSLVTAIRHLFPTAEGIRYFLKQDLSFERRTKLACVLVLRKCIRAFELVKLQLGGKERR